MSASHTYHQLTNYSPQRPWHQPLDDPRIASGFRICDENRRPPEFKTYPADLETIDLPTTPAHHKMPAAAVLSGVPAGTPADLTVAELARLLHHSAGVVRYRDTPHGRIHYRAAGSAGNRHPLETYMVTGGLPGLPAGTWHYDPSRHQLRRIGAPPTGDNLADFLVITGVPWRSAWKYSERAWRHLWWDCGTMLSQLLALADSTAIPIRLKLSFPDSLAAALVGADGIDEYPLAVVVLGDGQPTFTSRGHAQRGHLAHHPMRFPLITATQQATETAGHAWNTTPATTPPISTPHPTPEQTIDDVILARSSCRRFDTHTPLTESDIAWAMATATRPIPWDAGPTLLEHHVTLHHITATQPGIHRWHDGNLNPVCAGDQRQAAHHYCLHTDLARDAAWLAVHTTNLNATIDRLGERGYRAAHLEAGIVEGRLHLAAHTLGHAATGLVFNDELTPAFLRTNTTALLATALGTPARQATPGGPPRQPTRLRDSAPRTDRRHVP